VRIGHFLLWFCDMSLGRLQFFELIGKST